MGLVRLNSFPTQCLIPIIDCGDCRSVQQMLRYAKTPETLDFCGSVTPALVQEIEDYKN